MACTCTAHSPTKLTVEREQRGFHVRAATYEGALASGYAFSTIEELTDWLLETYAQPKEATNGNATR